MIKIGTQFEFLRYHPDIVLIFEDEETNKVIKKTAGEIMQMLDFAERQNKIEFED